MNIVKAIKAARNGNKVYRDIFINDGLIVRSWIPFVDLEKEKFTTEDILADDWKVHGCGKNNNNITLNKKFTEIIIEEGLEPKYEMRVSSDDDIEVVKIETGKIVFSSKSDDWEKMRTENDRTWKQNSRAGNWQLAG